MFEYIFENIGSILSTTLIAFGASVMVLSTLSFIFSFIYGNISSKEDKLEKQGWNLDEANKKRSGK